MAIFEVHKYHHKVVNSDTFWKPMSIPLLITTIIINDTFTLDNINLLNFSGFTLQTGIVYFFGFLLFHLGHLLFAIAFPLKAKSFMTDHTRIAHVVEMTIIIILGSLPGIVILSVSKYQIKSFLPYLCVPGSRDVFFYTLTLPIVIGATVGLTMLLTAFWILRRVSNTYLQYTYIDI